MNTEQTASNYQRFSEAYERHLSDCVKENPEKYHYGFDHAKLGRISSGEFQRYQELVGNRRGRAASYMLNLLKTKGIQ